MTVISIPKNEVQIREPYIIMDHMTVKRKNRVVTKVLVKWKHQLPEDDTWEFFYDFKQRFPDFHP